MQSHCPIVKFQQKPNQMHLMSQQLNSPWQDAAVHCIIKTVGKVAESPYFRIKLSTDRSLLDLKKSLKTNDRVLHKMENMMEITFAIQQEQKIRGQQRV